MERKPVDSSFLQNVGYDPTIQVLEVGFMYADQVWRYLGVTPREHEEMMGSASVGGYFHKHIKPNHTGQRVS